ncbi:protein kinase domain-containing protein [Streptomyces odontomachi]|uniref:serine/threonine-protein kinase n=1 Tax=Streptomyces odontomachi TaxID=2944940 RepID=UPI00210E7200|nr:serine/threonine-protein kinase [Streptomyces sp. ODS25]
MRLRAGDPEAIGGYTLQARLGAGGMGTVFLGRTPSGQPVAIKLIHQQFLHDDEFRTRFRQEVSAARRVSGKFTAAVVDADPDGAYPWMATTYISGPTLAQRIGEHGALHGPELRTLAIGLVEALRDIHRAGVVHRDLKPSNVVLSPDGPRVIDFGISRATDHQTLTMTGRVIGTPPFMSPEQLRSPREVGTESDVFSVATLLVYAATGQGPFDADSPYMAAYQVVHEAPALGRVPAPLRAVVEPCLAKDRSGRPSADELLRQLRNLPEDLVPPPATEEPANEHEVAGAEGGTEGGAEGGPPARRDAGTAVPDWVIAGKDAATSRSLGNGAVSGAAKDADDEADADVATRLLTGGASQAATAAAPEATQGRGTDADPGSADRPTLSTRASAAAPTSASDADDFPTHVAAAVTTASAASGAPAAADAGTDKDPGAPARTAHEAPLSEVRDRPHATFTTRVLRRRWRTAVAVAAAVAAISTGVALLGSGGSDQERAAGGGAGAGGNGRGSVTVKQAPLPPGFQPWQKTVSGGRQIPDELRCVARGDSAYCGGGGLVAARLKVADGTLVWKQASPGLPVHGMHMVGVADDTVVGYQIAASGSGPLQIVGLSTTDGRQLWSARIADSAAAFTGQPTEATLLDDTVFSVNVDRTAIEARQARTGKLRWASAFPAGSRCIPLVAGSHAYAMCGPVSEANAADVTHPVFHTLDPATGRLGNPVPVTGHLVPMGTADDGSLVVLRERTEGTVFDGYTHVVRIDPRRARATSVPVASYSGTAPGMAGGTLYFCGDDGVIHAVDPVTGKEKWSTQTSVEAASGPRLARGVLYFGAASGRVVALDGRTGRMRWSTNPRSPSSHGEFTGEFGSEPRVAVAGGALVVTARGNLVFSFAAGKPPKAS